jgi:hypothetical protein
LEIPLSGLRTTFFDGRHVIRASENCLINAEWIWFHFFFFGGGAVGGEGDRACITMSFRINLRKGGVKGAA